MCKWGCDSSSGYNEFMQLFHDLEEVEAEENVNEDESPGVPGVVKYKLEFHPGSIFMFSMVLLHLIGLRKEEDKTIRKDLLWTNPRSSSTQYCRPIKFK